LVASFIVLLSTLPLLLRKSYVGRIPFHPRTFRLYFPLGTPSLATPASSVWPMYTEPLYIRGKRLTLAFLIGVFVSSSMASTVTTWSAFLTDPNANVHVASACGISMSGVGNFTVHL
jgi:hypothetical protein